MKVIGLISGTSADGIDVALVEISGQKQDLKVELIVGETCPYPESVRSTILNVISGASLSMPELADLDEAIALAFAQACQIITQNHADVELIGSHGQTVYHRPPHLDQLGYSLQLGRGALIAKITGIPTITNFRAADLAAGGQGAPLAPCVDAFLLRDTLHTRCIQNIGGIGNVTYLPPAPASDVLGWDTGPGNSLIDLAVHHFSSQDNTGPVLTFDRDGAWAATGTPCLELVERWLQQDYFQAQPPKSTGRELFGQQYLENCLVQMNADNLSVADMLATLTELTASSIVHSYRNFLPKPPSQVLLCGGGSRNLYLKQRLQYHLDTVPVLTTDDFGINADFKEAIAFAVLAYWRWLGIPGNIPSVTGAHTSVLLGEIH